MTVTDELLAAIRRIARWTHQAHHEDQLPAAFTECPRDVCRDAARILALHEDPRDLQ